MQRKSLQLTLATLLVAISIPAMVYLDPVRAGLLLLTLLNVIFWRSRWSPFLTILLAMPVIAITLAWLAARYSNWLALAGAIAIATLIFWPRPGQRRSAALLSAATIGYLITSLTVMTYFAICEARLKIDNSWSRSDSIPSVLQENGFEYIEEFDDDYTRHTLFHGDRELTSWGYYHHPFSERGKPSFAIATFDNDPVPAIVLIDAESYRDRCANVTDTPSFFGITNNFPIYRMQNGKLLESCQVPAPYLIYFAERRSNFHQSPLATSSAYGGIIAGIGYGLFRRGRPKQNP